MLTGGLTAALVEAAPPVQAQQGPKVTPVEYEGWRLYSVNCARCHGQDVLGNPVAADLLALLGPTGRVKTPEQFVDMVTAGAPASGMPAFKTILTPKQIKAMYAYIKGRAEKRIPPGRPAAPRTQRRAEHR